MIRVDRTDGVRVLMDVHCSKGTYRTLCADIGKHLVSGHMSFLLRQRAGAFDIDSAYTLEQLSEMKEQDLIKMPSRRLITYLKS